jgi:hypothetical protein
MELSFPTLLLNHIATYIKTGIYLKSQLPEHSEKCFDLRTVFKLFVFVIY